MNASASGAGEPGAADDSAPLLLALLLGVPPLLALGAPLLPSLRHIAL
jgi:hypothetical protein